MNVLPKRLMLIAHAGTMTVLLLFLSSADWNHSQKRSSQAPPQSLHLAEVVTSPDLHHHLPLA
ncbi:MAG: hypothetical protein WA902_23850 [Thermosynechococcaceae cyanobacterium]